MVLADRERKCAMARGDQQTRQTKTEESCSCLPIECGKQSKLEFQAIIEVNDRREKVRVATNSGAAGLDMPEGMFPRVNVERKTAPKKIAWVRRQFRSRQMRGVTEA